MCDVSPRLVNSTLGNYWAPSFTEHITVVLFQKNTFQRLKSFFWLVGRSCNASIWSRGEKTFQPVKFFFAYFFGRSISWGPGSIELACHGFASAGAVTLGSALSPMTIPWPSQVSLHHLSQSHGAFSHPNPQPKCCRATVIILYVWEKTFCRLKSFFSTRLKRGIATATRQPEKTCQLVKSFFWPFPTQKVSKKTHLVVSGLIKSPR